MPIMDIAAILKRIRNEKGIPVKDVIKQLKKHGVSISDKTLYGWENGNRQPDADEFLVLCEIYDVTSFAELKNDETDDIILSPHEEKVVTAYRDKPEMQNAVDVLLGINVEEPDAERKPTKLLETSKSLPRDLGRNENSACALKI